MALNSSCWTKTIIKIDSMGNEFCYVPKVQFIDGEGSDRRTLKIEAAFYIAKYTVTKKDFLRFLDDTGYEYSEYELLDMLAPTPDSPVTPVSWYDAKQYVRWLRHLTQEYYSLPNEEEWEVAARGEKGNYYPWGNSPDPNSELPVFSVDDEQKYPEPVGSKPAGDSPFGCSQMAGNVWEWTLEDVDDIGNEHILCGGSSLNGPEFCTCLSKLVGRPKKQRVPCAGFRLIYLPDELYAQYRIEAMSEEAVKSYVAYGDTSTVHVK
ncbi:MAG: SUMF1/EgtB/PvdO family nonheme iron enzyme [Verrucomicrobiota bacterium]|nr:SUMF1/EgtB/PvdO family nonheme iron enzyme [Verrucomicrobiota bacterium]